MSKKLNRQMRRAFKKLGRSIAREARPIVNQVGRDLKGVGRVAWRGVKKEGNMYYKKGLRQLQKNAPKIGRFAGGMARDIVVGALANRM